MHEPVTTFHQGVFNGLRVDYNAVLRETVVPDGNGVPSVRLACTEYVAVEGDQRPVMFVCNGGPIVAATPLHMAALGPRRIAYPDDIHADPSGFRTVDNEYCPLDVADIVFFDPAGTGYSRVLDGVDPGKYHGVEADAQQMTAWIETWLREHDRLGSPVYLVGESYGTIRVAVVARMLANLPNPVAVQGVVLISQAANIIETSSRPANILSYVVSLPTLAAIAWYHGKIDTTGRSLDDVVAEASGFAATEYLAALYQGTRLPAAQREPIAHRLTSLTGIPASRWLERNLRMPKHAFRVELLAEEGLVLYMYDGRYAGPPAPPPPDEDGKSFAATVMGPQPTGVGAIENAIGPAMAAHLRDFLKVGWPEDYRDADPAAANSWIWGQATSPFGDWPYMAELSTAMAKLPEMRLLICTGAFDLSTTMGAAEHAVNQSTWPVDRVRTETYAGGHMMYSIEASLRQLTDDLREFIRPRP
ncbi:carboxypeptidase C (cathepsin A) [Kibdelosporangium banguiense]|uniref:Carboxypeptidase C (Cathepsin A) n=1 Tax=Kibdelosporangium banguiense TaxID=1365924 RepID=A0ABS4TZA0_9PSEU|nr:hypothetical protein [Kibdelosporangium banguiense]MBP2329240.1 carboxypeptidase C (cathepsin A) [Kibdelosporangium banguiense]